MGRFRVDQLSHPAAPLLGGAGRVLVPRCYRARGPLGRMVGLLATKDLAVDEAVWLEPCRSVHTWGMHIPLAVVFVDRAGTVIAMHEEVRPGRVVSCRGARSVVETRVGALHDLKVGDQVIGPTIGENSRK